MKKLELKLEIEFNEDVTCTDDEVAEIMDKVLSALIHEVDHGNGIAPDTICGTYTKSILIREPFSGQDASYNFLTSNYGN